MEAEWVAACHVGKMILFFRSVLHDLNIPQHHATVMFEDNRGAVFMANAQQTSQRTRHIDIKHFALIDWVEQDLMVLDDIPTAENCADSLTKATAKILFHCHNDTIMGRRIPPHIKNYLDGGHEAHNDNHVHETCDHSCSVDEVHPSTGPQNTGG
jgi:hypothetical protein